MNRYQLNPVQERLLLLTAAHNPEILLLEKGLMLCSKDQRPVAPTVEMNIRFMSVVLMHRLSYRFVEVSATDKARGCLFQWEISFPRARRASLLAWAETLRYPSSRNDVLIGETLDMWINSEEKQAKRLTPMRFTYDESVGSAVRQTLNLLLTPETPMAEHRLSFQGRPELPQPVIFDTDWIDESNCKSQVR